MKPPDQADTTNQRGFLEATCEPMSMSIDSRQALRLPRRSGIRPALRSDAGLSLVELLMVISIFAILVAIAIPNMVSARQGFQMTTASATMRHRLAEARMESLKRNRLVNVVLDGAARTLTTSVNNGGVMTVIAGPEYLPSGVVFDLGGAATTTITFDSLGRPTAPTSFSLDYPGSGLTRTLSVLTTGRITLQ